MKSKIWIYISIIVVFFFIGFYLNKPEYPQRIWGINSHGAYYPSMTELGITMARIDVVWAGIEKTKGIYDFTPDNARVDTLLKNNLSVLAILAYHNKNYVYGNGEFSVPSSPYLGSKFPYKNDAEFEMYKKGYGDFVFAAVSNFKGKVKYFEIQNEPYGFDFNYFKDEESKKLVPYRYTQLLKEAYTRAKEANPDVIILNAGMGTTGELVNYMSSMYQYGAKDYFDIMSIHYPYFNPNASFDKWLNIMKDYGDGNKQIWITEDGRATFGCWRINVTEPPYGCDTIPISPEFQNNYLAAQLGNVTKFPQITGYFVYEIRDASSGYNWTEYNYGITYSNHTKKPAFYTYQKAINKTLSLPSQTPVQNKTPKDQVIIH